MSGSTTCNQGIETSRHLGNRVEYALRIALIAMIAIPSVSVLGDSVSLKFEQAADGVAGLANIPQCPEDNPDC